MFDTHGDASNIIGALHMLLEMRRKDAIFYSKLVVDISEVDCNIIDGIRQVVLGSCIVFGFIYIR